MDQIELDKLVDAKVDEAIKAIPPQFLKGKGGAGGDGEGEDDSEDDDKKETPAAKSFTQADLDAAVKTAAEQAVESAVKSFDAKFKALQRPPMVIAAKSNDAPARINRSPKYYPFLWAVKAAQMTGGKIVFDLSEPDRELQYEGSADAVKAFKAMASAVGSNLGEHFIPTILSSTVIDQLYADDVMGNLDGVMKLPMPGLTVDIPGIGAFTAAWTAENGTINSNDANTFKKTMTAKKLTAMAKVPNELLVDSNPAIEAFIQRGLRGAIGQARNIGFIRGAGGNGPTGITSLGVQTGAGGSNFFDEVIQGVARMYIAELPVDGNLRVLVRPEVASKALRTRETTEGGYLIASQPVDKALVTPGFVAPLSNFLGLPVYQTTGIETDTNSSDILVVHAPSIIVGDRQTLEITVSKEAGTAFETDQTWIRAITRGDIEVTRTDAVQVITDFAH